MEVESSKRLMAGGGALGNLRLANHPVNSHQFNQHKGVRDLRACPSEGFADLLPLC